MIEIIVNIGWGLAAAVVGVLIIAIGMVVICAPFIGAMFAFDELDVKERILRRAQWLRGKGELAQGAVIIGLMLMMSLCIGVAAIGWSEKSFGWPDAPSWMNIDTDEKKECASA